VHLNGCRRSLDQAEVDKSKVSEKLLDAQHEILHLKSSLEVMLANYCLNTLQNTALCWFAGCRPAQLDLCLCLSHSSKDDGIMTDVAYTSADMHYAPHNKVWTCLEA